MIHKYSDVNVTVEDNGGGWVTITFHSKLKLPTDSIFISRGTSTYFYGITNVIDEYTVQAHFKHDIAKLRNLYEKD